MIVILEGMEGSGKSTLAESLSMHMSIPVYRPFRTAPGEHFDKDSTLRDDLEEMGVAPNTYIEDLYVADVLTGTMANVILDRSMPSGYAYGNVDGVAPSDVLEKALQYWLWRLSVRNDVLYVNMQVTKDLSRSRVVGRDHLFNGSRWSQLDYILQGVAAEASRRFKFLQLDASLDKKSLLFKVLSEVTR